MVNKGSGEDYHKPEQQFYNWMIEVVKRCPSFEPVKLTQKNPKTREPRPDISELVPCAALIAYHGLEISEERVQDLRKAIEGRQAEDDKFAKRRGRLSEEAEINENHKYMTGQLRAVRALLETVQQHRTDLSLNRGVKCTCDRAGPDEWDIRDHPGYRELRESHDREKTDLRKDIRRKDEHWRAQVEKLEKKNAQLKTELGGWQVKLEERINQVRSEFEKQLAHYKQQLEAARQSELSTINSKHDSVMEAMKREHDGRLRSLQEEKETAGQQFTESQAQHKLEAEAYNRKLDAVERELESSRESETAAVDRLRALERGHQDTLRELKSLRDREDEAQRTLDITNKEIQSERSKSAAAKADATSSKLKHDLEEIKGTLGKAKESLKNAEKEKEDAVNRAFEFQEELGKTQLEVGQWVANFQHLERQYADCSQQVTSLQKKLEVSNLMNAQLSREAEENLLRASDGSHQRSLGEELDESNGATGVASFSRGLAQVSGYLKSITALSEQFGAGNGKVQLEIRYATHAQLFLLERLLLDLRETSPGLDHGLSSHTSSSVTRYINIIRSHVRSLCVLNMTGGLACAANWDSAEAELDHIEALLENLPKKFPGLHAPSIDMDTRSMEQIKAEPSFAWKMSDFPCLPLWVE